MVYYVCHFIFIACAGSGLHHITFAHRLHYLTLGEESWRYTSSQSMKDLMMELPSRERMTTQTRIHHKRWITSLLRRIEQHPITSGGECRALLVTAVCLLTTMVVTPVWPRPYPSGQQLAWLHQLQHPSLALTRGIGKAISQLHPHR